MCFDTDARIVITLKDEFAKSVVKDGLQYCGIDELKPLQDMLAEQKASLTSVMKDFEYYVQSSDAHGAESSPIIEWSRDATKSERARAYYATKFVVTFGAGKKVISGPEARKVSKKLGQLIEQGVIEGVRVDFMDPDKNPPIPARYLKKQQP